MALRAVRVPGGIALVGPDEDDLYERARQRGIDDQAEAARASASAPLCAYFKNESCSATCAGRGHCLAAA